MPPIPPEDLDPQHFDDDDADSPSAPKGRPEVQDLVYRTPGESPTKPDFNDLVYRTQPPGRRTPANDNDRKLSDFSKATFQYASDKAGTQDKTPAPPAHMVFDEVGPAWYGNPADLAAQASSMGLQYSKQANPTLAQIRKRSQTLGQGDIYVYSGHGGKLNGKPHLAAHGEADESKGEVPIQYDRVGLTGGYKQKGTGFAVDQLKDDIAQGKNGVPMMVFISGCEVGAKDLSGLNDAGVSMAISAGGKTSERDAPRQMQAFMDVLTKGGTINDALKAVNEIVDQDNRHKLDDDERQEPFTAVFRNGITGDSTLEDLRRHNAQINDERKSGMKKEETPKP